MVSEMKMPIDDYDGQLEGIRQSEYPQLYEPATLGTSSPKLRSVYLDHTGATLYSATHVHAHTKDMLGEFPGNPHSQNPQSARTQEKIEKVRAELLGFVGTTEARYAVIFTANATASIRLAGEMMPFSTDPALPSKFVYATESHNSVIGLRKIAADRGVGEITSVDAEAIGDSVLGSRTPAPSLVAYPAQCNFSGERFPLTLADEISKAQHEGRRDSGAPGSGRNRWWVLLDAAAYASTSPLRLDDLLVGPDFVTLSMYKIFGMPTGLGVLLVKRSVVPYIRERQYFAGGTVLAVAYDKPWEVLHRNIEERYEDGTVNFQSIVSLGHGIAAHRQIYGSMERISSHVSSISKYALAMISGLRHSNGNPICEVYVKSPESHGSAISFNVKDRAGGCIGNVEVERLAAMHNISLRAGRFCNPGAAAKWLGLTSDLVIKYVDIGIVCGDDNDVIDGKPTGAIRASFGAMTSAGDIDRLAAFIQRSFCDYTRTYSAASYETLLEEKSAIEANKTLVRVKGLVVYPIKSCHGWPVPPAKPWPITEAGLQFDRTFAIMRENSAVPMQQKRFPKMALICPQIDLEAATLTIEAAGHAPLSISLRAPDLALEPTTSKMCGAQSGMFRVAVDEVSEWLTAVLDIPCYLACNPTLLLDPEALALPQPTANSSACGLSARLSTLSFANEAQLLLVTEESAQQVADWVAEEDRSISYESVSPLQYRPNIIVSGPGKRKIKAFSELQWKELRVGKCTFKVDKPCRRCQMIGVNQESAKVFREPYSTLARKMRVDGKVVFGVYVNLADARALGTIASGMNVFVD